VDVGEGELDDVIGEGLHLAVDAEAVPVDFLVLFGLLEAEGIKPFGDGVVFAEGFFAGHDGEAPLGTDPHHQQFVLLVQLVGGDDAVDLPQLEDHTVLPGEIVELEPFLADPLDSVGASE
jgi:hypothetical protein